MTPQDIARLRLARQQIAQPSFSTPAEVVAWLGAVQAQDYLAAKWAIGLRVPDATDAAIEQAIAERTIVRTWPMRGTLHFIAPADIRWLLALLTPRIVAGAAGRYRQLGLTDADFARARDVVIAALEGGRQLTRNTLYQVLAAGGVSSEGQRGIHILGRLAQEGLICFASHQGKQPAFALLDEWVPPAPALDREATLAEVARRYFTGHGPATLQDFVWWTGLTVADARAGLEAVKGELVQTMVDGQTYWLAPGATVPDDALAGLYLLPGYDEYLLGYSDRTAALDPAHARQYVHPGANGVFHPIIVAAGGRVVGTWRRAVKTRGVVVEGRPFVPLDDDAATAFAAAAARYARFLGLPLDSSGTFLAPPVAAQSTLEN